MRNALIHMLLRVVIFWVLYDFLTFTSVLIVTKHGSGSEKTEEKKTEKKLSTRIFFSQTLEMFQQFPSNNI